VREKMQLNIHKNIINTALAARKAHFIAIKNCPFDKKIAF
jgi:hypothetical protein